MGKCKAITASGSLQGFLFSGLVLLAGLAVLTGHLAFAQDAPPACAPAIARVVSLQGNVEVQRAGAPAWNKVSRLDTSLCTGDRLRTDALSRAALFVQPETLVRVDQNTAISIGQTADEILVEFHIDEISQAARNAQSCGAGYFITRFPRKFKVSTPHMNAAVEGTEFLVESSCKASTLTVIEGQVLSQVATTQESRSLTAGQRLLAGPDVATAFSTVVSPTDAVQWVLHFPPLSDAPAQGVAPAAEQAEELLQIGRVDEALKQIGAALAVNARDGNALALRSIIEITKNDKTAALATATAATTADPDNHRGWLAISYAQQASFELDLALASARRAGELKPGSSLINARVAELLMSLGRVREAEASARAAVASNPHESRAHSVLGFVRLAQLATHSAREHFTEAITRDSFSPLPRLGLGLALIRDGNLVNGREQIEIAVALDPSNSLLRSYVGKAYYEENTRERDNLASTQLTLAKDLDPNDPTPWFYDSVLKVSQSRPAEALRNLDQSTALNDGRAIYRSRQLLDLDLAARGASQASVYNELGFHQVGLQQAARSLAADPGSGSAHRFLADINASLPRHEISRASELLQAQLRLPIGAPPLQPQVANDVLFKNTFFGPATVGLNEFNPLFLQDGLDFQLFGLLGTDETFGGQAIFSGLNGPWSFSVSQFAADTDGYRANNDDSLRQSNGFVYWQAAPATSLQLEITSASREFGDLTSAFDPENFSDIDRNDEDVDTQRLGFRQIIGPESDVLVSVIRQDRRASLEAPGILTIINEDESWKAEAQYLTDLGGHDVILGSSYFDADSREEVVVPPLVFADEFEPHHFNAYGYLSLATPGDQLQLQIGASYDDLSSDVGKQSELNPKIGLIWNVTNHLTLRSAGYRVVTRRINSDQGLEPTQVAGFNQFFDDRNGTVSESVGVAADFRFTATLAGGLEVSRRDLEVPAFDALTGEVFFQQQREDVASGYVYWLPNDRVSVALEPRYHDFEHGTTFESMELTEIPISVKFILPSGIWMGISVTGVDQSGAFDGPAGPARGSDSFWPVDAIVAYRLPRRRGTISIEGKNLFDEEFRFQEIDLGVSPRYIPELQAFMRFSLSF